MNGAPAHSTTGLASASWSQPTSRESICPSIANASSGTDSASPTQNRRVMSASSGFGASPPAMGCIGSSAMPQIGQEPGASRITSGCIGQVHGPPGAAALGIEAGRGPRNRSGSAVNRSRQRAPQKQ
jgi:hypothetical protein